MNHKPLNCLVACAVATTLALASPALGRGGGGHGGGGSAADARRGRRRARRLGEEGCMPWEEECVSAVSAGLRILPARVLPVCLSRMRGSHRAFRTVHSITASSTPLPSLCIHWRSLRLRRLRLTTPTMTTAGAGYGQPMDCSGPTSAGTTATIKLAGLSP